MGMSLDEQLQALAKANSEGFTYEMLLGPDGDGALDIIQMYIIAELNDDNVNGSVTDSRIVDGLKAFFDKYLVSFACDNRGIELDLRMLSCHNELMRYYVNKFKNKFDIVEYFCIFSDGVEDEQYIQEFMGA